LVVEYPIHDIPNYPFLFIREGSFVFKTDKTTGEISEQLSLGDYCLEWQISYRYKPAFRDFYTKGLFFPKDNPDTAGNLADLLKLCSDKTRHRKGDEGFLLHFLWKDQCTLTETKLFKLLCDYVVVWNYSVLDDSDMHTKLNLKSKKHAGRVFTSLEQKGLIKTINTKFDDGGDWKKLIKVHPKLFWKGRHSAWALAVGNTYEYGEDIEIS